MIVRRARVCERAGMTGVDERESHSLRSRLRAGERSLVDRYAGRIDAVERARPVFVIAAGLVAALTAGSRFVEGTPGIVAATVGIVTALVFGALVGWMDFRKLEISREVRDVTALADDALARMERAETAAGEQVRGRALREERLIAGEVMRDAIGSAVAGQLPVGDALDSMLDSARLRLVAACGFDAGEYWAVTIFAQQGEEMRKIAALWNDRTASAQPSRSWRKGEGFTGVAWRNGRIVVVPDVEEPGLADAYLLPAEKQRGYDLLRYRSSASIPIIVDGAIWGVVTATSNLARRFDVSGAGAVEATDTIREVAHYAALLASIASLYAEDDDEEE